MSSPTPKVGPPSSGSASRSSSIASNPPVILPEGNGNIDQETSPSPPQYPPILGGSSASSTPPSLRRTMPATSTTATVTTGTQAQKLRDSASVSSKGSGAAILGARSSSDETGITSFTADMGFSSTTTVSNARASKHQGPPQPLPPKPSVVLSGATSSIIVSGVSSDSPTTSGTTTSLTSTRRRNLPEEASSKALSQTASIVAIRDMGNVGAGYSNDLRSLHSAGGGRRPVKVWNASRTIRKALVVATYEEFQRKGREKVGLSPSEPVRVVLEGDGTQVDDGEYFQTLPENTIFLFLRPGELWRPVGADSIRSGKIPIPILL